MDENINVSAENQEVAAPVNDVSDTQPSAEVSVTTTPSAENQEVAAPETDNRRTADAAFADLRRRYQTSQGELENVRGQNERAKQILEKLGFGGETMIDSLDAAESHFTGQAVDVIKRDRLARDEAAKREAALKGELAHYRIQELRRQQESDLKAIRKIDPNVKSLNDLGKPFFDLVRKGVDGETAFRVLKAKEADNTKAAPPAIGRVNSKTTEEKDYYTDKELDALTSKELDDPKVLEKALKSMTRNK